MARACIMWHDNAEDKFAVKREYQENRSTGEVYYTLRLGGDLSVFLSPERLRELGAVIAEAVKSTRCECCNGTGKNAIYRKHLTKAWPCPDCNGTGCVAPADVAPNQSMPDRAGSEQPTTAAEAEKLFDKGRELIEKGVVG